MQDRQLDNVDGRVFSVCFWGGCWLLVCGWGEWFAGSLNDYSGISIEHGE